MNERDIFLSILEIDDPAEREAQLESACAGDIELLGRVEALLASHESQSQFLNTPAVEQMADDSAAALAETMAPEDGSTHDEPVSNTDEADTMIEDSDDEIPLGYLEPSTREDSLGRLGHYEITEVIGRGAFGIVLKAFDEKLHRVVALKVLSPEMAATSPARKRFKREARSSAVIRHENVVSIYAVEDEPTPYLVMEYIPGKTLQERLDEKGPLEVTEVLRLGKQIADGLAAAHAQDLIHRDVKPANILLETSIDDHVKITDFGLARTADDASMTQSGVIAGSPMYMAPEQALGNKLDQRADLFSLGSVLYQMVSGRPPFRAPSTLAVLKRVADDTPRAITEIIPETPEWICELIGHLHAKNPDERYATAKEVSQLLAQCLDDLKAGRKPKITAPKPVGDDSTVRAAKPVEKPIEKPILQRSFAKVAAVVLLLFIAIGISEGTGVTDWTSTVIRIAYGEGTLVIESNDPGVKISIDGEEITIRGSGIEKLTLRPGEYKIAATKDGKQVKQELVTITRDGRTIVRMTLETGGLTVARAKSSNVLTPVSAANYALDFEDKNAYIEVPSLSNQLGDGPFTIEGYMTLGPDMSEDQRVTLFHDSSSIFLHVQHKKSWQFWRTTEEKGSGSIAREATAFGVRAHVAAVWDGTNRSLYVNGQQQSVINGRIGKVRLIASIPVRIGGIGRASKIEVIVPYGIDEIRISTVARYTKDFSPAKRFDSDEHTLALYHFDEGRDSILNDASDNGHHGKIVGAKWVNADGTSIEPPSIQWPADAPPPAVAPFDAEQAKQHQQAWAKYLGVPVEYTNTLGMKFRLVPPGEFLMGSTPEEIEEQIEHAKTRPNWEQVWHDRLISQGPRHKVILTQPLYLGITEVTQAQYLHVMGTNPSHFSANGQGKEVVAGVETSNHPVESVSWNDVAEFCAKLCEQEQLKPFYQRSGKVVTVLEGTGYRLPTEAEWEFACRAGTTTRFWSGNKDSDLRQSDWEGGNSGIRTHAVGKLRINPFGMFDIHGNVREWVEDIWEKDYYKNFTKQPAIDPRHAVSVGKAAIRSCRGGSALVGPPLSISAHRGSYGQDLKRPHAGFRVALTVDAVKKLLSDKPAAVAPFTDAAVERIAALPAEEQVEEVRQELKRRNPDFDAATLKYTVNDGVVVGLVFLSDHVTDISPVRALTGLQSLDCSGSWDPINSIKSGLSQLTDLSPLRGLVLTSLECNGTEVADLSPLEGMALERLSLAMTPVSDLSAIDAQHLTYLNLNITQVTDARLAHFNDCQKLRTLRLGLRR